jgi:hypothetical protein
VKETRRHHFARCLVESGLNPGSKERRRQIITSSILIAAFLSWDVWFFSSS